MKCRYTQINGQIDSLEKIDYRFKTVKLKYRQIKLLPRHLEELRVWWTNKVVYKVTSHQKRNGMG